MTAESPGTERELIFDTVVLNHFALAERLDVLASLVAGRPCATTTVVLEELRAGAGQHPALTNASELEWVRVIVLDQPAEIRGFANWVRRLGGGLRDLGEASVFAAAELRGAVAVTDDRAATRVGRAYGLTIHGTIWLLAGACRSGKLTETGAGALVDSLRQTGHRLPCTGREFPAFARSFGLL
jgi:predicted nucleic acid-binding protein